MLLSLCIPTHNFGDYITECLDSILPQLNDEIELIILDSASTDHTKKIVQDKINKRSNVSYIYHDFKGGIDSDMNALINYSSGKYCWLLSADDVLKKNAIKKIMKFLKKDYDVILVEHTICDINMNPLYEYPIFKNINKVTKFNFSLKSDLNFYIKNARTSEAYFSFLSGPIFKRELWNNSKKFVRKFEGSCWILAANLLSKFFKINLLYSNENLIFKRGDNDSFSKKGIVNRFSISIINFEKIAKIFFSHNTSIYNSILKTLRFDWPLLRIIWVKSKSKKTKYDKKLFERCIDLYFADKTITNSVLITFYKKLPICVAKFFVMFKPLLALIKKSN